jgi:hypothetical protein
VNCWDTCLHCVVVPRYIHLFFQSLC